MPRTQTRNDMSTVLNTQGEAMTLPEADPRAGRYYIVTAEWNPAITHALRDGAVDTLLKAGVDRDMITQYGVPGTVELVYAAGRLSRLPATAAVIVIGCVIRGDTPHFDYVCMQAANGIAAINSRGEVPVIFGVLTVDNLPQAQERAGGALGNKGAEAAAAAISMASFSIANPL